MIDKLRNQIITKQEWTFFFLSKKWQKLHTKQYVNHLIEWVVNCHLWSSWMYPLFLYLQMFMAISFYMGWDSLFFLRFFVCCKKIEVKLKLDFLRMKQCFMVLMQFNNIILRSYKKLHILPAEMKVKFEAC